MSTMPKDDIHDKDILWPRSNFSHGILCVISQYHLGDLSYGYNYQQTCLPTYVPTLILPIYLPTKHIPSYLPTCLPTYLPTYLPNYTCLSIYVFTFLPIYIG
jgi:hypothetical protein